MRTHFGLAANDLDPIHDLVVEAIVLSHRIVDSIAPFDETRQYVVHIIDGKCVIDFQFLARHIGSHQGAMPKLFRLVFLLTEQHHLSLFAPRNERQQRLRLGESGQIMEITVLSIEIFCITIANAGWRGRQQGDAVWLHLRHQFLAPKLHFPIFTAHSILDRALSYSSISRSH